MVIVTCAYDGCHDFVPGSAIGKYCVDCRCKRKEEARVKRLEKPVDCSEELFELQERRKDANAERVMEKNKWLLANKRFCAFDIETTDLAANFGTIVCASIKDYDGETKTFVTRGDSDEAVVRMVRAELAKFDYAVTWYGSKFDIPFITTRGLIGSEREYEPQIVSHIDLYYTARHRLRLHSNRLDCVTEALYGDSGKTRLSPEWRLGLRSISPAKRRASIDYHVEHCEIDVAETEKLFTRLAPLRDLGATQRRRY